MGRLKINMVTMAMMLMVTAAIAGFLHLARLELGEAVEGENVVYANLVVCGFGALTDGMFIVAVHRRWEGVVLLWVMSALVRVNAHGTVAIFMLLSSFNYPSIVFAIYLIAFAACLMLGARHAFLFRAFLRSGQEEVDDNPSVREAVASVKCQRHLLAFNPLAVNPSELFECARVAPSNRGDSPPHAAMAAPTASNRITSLLRWDRDYGKPTKNLSSNVSTPSLPDRAFGFDSSSGEGSPNSTSIPKSSTSFSSFSTTNNEIDSEIFSPQVVHTTVKMASVGPFRRPRIVPPTDSRELLSVQEASRSGSPRFASGAGATATSATGGSHQPATSAVLSVGSAARARHIARAPLLAFSATVRQSDALTHVN